MHRKSTIQPAIMKKVSSFHHLPPSRREHLLIYLFSGLCLLLIAACASQADNNQTTLTSADQSVRSRAWDFVQSMIDAAGKLGGSAIVGSLQGRWGDGVDREMALGFLREGLSRLGEHARQYNVPLLYEPLNRYETNVINNLADGVSLLQSLSSDNVKLLADLYHMNIEESDLAEALRSAGAAVGHVHFADSNRRPMGMGHTDVAPIAEALREMKYDGLVSAECLPYPTSEKAAEATIRAFKKYFR